MRFNVIDYLLQVTYSSHGFSSRAVNIKTYSYSPTESSVKIPPGH